MSDLYCSECWSNGRLFREINFALCKECMEDYVAEKMVDWPTTIETKIRSLHEKLRKAKIENERLQSELEDESRRLTKCGKLHLAQKDEIKRLQAQNKQLRTLVAKGAWYDPEFDGEPCFGGEWLDCMSDDDQKLIDKCLKGKTKQLRERFNDLQADIYLKCAITTGD